MRGDCRRPADFFPEPHGLTWWRQHKKWSRFGSQRFRLACHILNALKGAPISVALTQIPGHRQNELQSIADGLNALETPKARSNSGWCDTRQITSDCAFRTEERKVNEALTVFE